ncbi:hypothetical protein MMC16_002659 [Acarospora aff. strigata]|nr:hypothetical protein [Acarospora aff. strigata]
MARIQDTKDSLLEGTCSWILTDSNYEKWYHDQLSRVLWVHGDPGKGKTMLAISQITRLRNRIDNSAATLSYFFCDNKDNRRNNAVHVLRGLLYQLLCQRPDSIMFLRDEYEKQKSQLFSSPTALQCLWRVLESVLRQSTDGIAWLVIDALDECEPESRGILLSRIKSRVSGQRGVTRESSNNQEKWFLTSRNEPLIKDSMTGSLDISLESNSVNVEADVEEFINAQVQELQETKKYREDFMMSIKQILSEKAGGTFLWVSLACAELKKAPGIQAKKVLKRLPSGLNAFYEQLLHRTLDNEDEELAGYARDILVAVLAAFRPLSLSELAVMAGLPQEHWADEGSIREYAEQCGSFLTIRQQDVHFVHQSAKDYLSSLKTFVSSPNLAEEHKTLTSRCLNYFCSGVFDAGPINLHSDDSLSANDSTSDIEDETSCDSISIIEESRGEAARYPIMLWMAHGQAASSDLWDSLNQAQAFFSPTSVVRDAWFTTYWDFHYGFPAPGDCSLLHIAVHSDIEALLAKILPWTKHTINWTDHDGQTPLAWASSIGIEAVMKLLLGVEGVEIDSKNDVGRTPLSLAAIKEYDRYVKLLLEHGALPNTEDTSSRTPLSYAAEYGSESCVELLLDSGALPNTENTQGRTPLSYAAECGNESCLKLLLESGALPNTENTRGRTPLSYAAECGNESCLKLLLESGALPNTEDTFSRTPLSYAAGDGDESCLKLLLESGALPNTEDTRGQTPLSYAARCGSESCLKLLLESGALPDIESTLGGLPLLYAAYRGNESCLKLLLESGALPDIQNNLGETLLALAARCGNLSCVELLLDSGAKPDFEDDKGQTPLSYATEGLASTPEHSRQRYEAVVKLLLKSGAKADSKDDNGCTPLAFAAGCGNLSCVELLLDSGAKPDFEDNDGQTPLSYATGGLVHGPEHSRKSYQTIVMLLSASVAELDSGRSSTESMNMAEATGQRSQQSNKRPRIS